MIVLECVALFSLGPEYDVGRVVSEKLIWEGRRPEAFSVLRAWLRDEGVTIELMADIAHSFTQINQHPHDPHYVTVPTAVYELIPHLDDGDREIILAQVVDFAINRIHRYGLTK